MQTFELWAFPFRLALCDLELRQAMFVYSLDVACDIWFFADILLGFAVAIPSGTYTGQKESAKSFKRVAKIYFRHELGWNILPIMLYQITTQVLLAQPWKAPAGAPGQTHWIWCFAAFPRIVLRLRRFLKYFAEIVINPDVNIKHMQAIRIGLVILLSAHWVGCIFYFLARALNKDDTTWLAEFEKLVPLYDRSHTSVSYEYCLCIYKGFNTLTALGYDGGMPKNLIELFWRIIVLCIQVQLSGLILGTLLNYLVRRDPVEEAHKQQLESVRQYLSTKSVSWELRERVVRYYVFQYQVSFDCRGLHCAICRSDPTNIHDQDITLRKCSRSQQLSRASPLASFRVFLQHHTTRCNVCSIPSTNSSPCAKTLAI